MPRGVLCSHTCSSMREVVQVVLVELCNDTCPRVPFWPQPSRVRPPSHFDFSSLHTAVLCIPTWWDWQGYYPVTVESHMSWCSRFAPAATKASTVSVRPLTINIASCHLLRKLCPDGLFGSLLRSKHLKREVWGNASIRSSHIFAQKVKRFSSNLPTLCLVVQMANYDKQLISVLRQGWKPWGGNCHCRVSIAGLVLKKSPLLVVFGTANFEAMKN